MEDLLNSVNVVAQHDHDTFLILGFLRRAQKALLTAFSEYNLKPTKYHPDYAHIKGNKRVNYLFYSNWDGLPNNSKNILI